MINDVSNNYYSNYNPDPQNYNSNQGYSGETDPYTSSGYTDRTVTPTNLPLPSEMRKDLEDLYKQVSADSALSYDQKNDLLAQIKNLKIKLAGVKDGTPPSQEILDQFRLIHTQFAQVEADIQQANADAQTQKAQAEAEAQQKKQQEDEAHSFVGKIDDLSNQIEKKLANPNLSTEMKDKLNELKTQLGTAKSSLDLTPNADTLAKAQKTFSQVKKDFDGMGEDIQKDIKYPNWVDEFANFTGTSASKIVDAIKSTYLSAPADEKDFNRWLKDNFPPMNGNDPVLDEKFAKFLTQADPTLASAMDGLKGKKMRESRQEVKDMQQRLVKDLNTLFKDKGVEISTGAVYRENYNDEIFTYSSRMIPTIQINGKTYSCFDRHQFNNGAADEAARFPKDFGADSLQFSARLGAWAKKASQED